MVTKYMLQKIKNKEKCKIYYQKKIKPLRKPKQHYFYHSIKCPMCSRRSFMRNLKYPMDFNVSLVGFGGNKKITWKKNQYDKEAFTTIWKSLKKRVILLVSFFGITQEELGFEKVGDVRTQSYLKSQTPTRTNINFNCGTPLRTNTNIKIGGLTR